MSEDSRILITPAETIPKEETIKRLLLFFNTVFLIHPDDAALINDGEVVIEAPNHLNKYTWAPRVIYPREDNYKEKFAESVSKPPPQIKKHINKEIFFCRKVRKHFTKQIVNLKNIEKQLSN
jgi:hypothetical protein